MLELHSQKIRTDCSGLGRRDCLKVGSLGLAGLSLPQLLAARAQADTSTAKRSDTSVVWLWLGGGPTHVETFDPKLTAPREFRSITGEVATNLPGVTLGGHFEKTAQVADKMAFVRSFAHKNSGHGGGTHWVMTGYDNRLIDNGGLPSRPSLGAITSRYRGANHPETGMPTYVRMNGIGSDGPAFLGTPFAPFDPQGQASRNMKLDTKLERLDNRRELLASLDTFQRQADASGLMNGLDAFEEQAFNLILGQAPAAFDLKQEDPRTVERYQFSGSGMNRNRGNNSLGQQLLIARRLCEAGCGFVTIQYGGWDMHTGLAQSMGRIAPALDHALATFVQDVYDRGLSEKILLVVTGEFGRTPRVNRSAGRDHWAPLSTLALAGGGLKMGQVVGQSSAKAEIPATRPISPGDLMATVFHVLGIDPKLQYQNQGGRPVFMLEEGHVIPELV